jgi:hypothetical protein
MRAFLILVNISAMGSVIVMNTAPSEASEMKDYQLDLITPGISPLKAMERKQIRQIPNFLR